MASIIRQALERGRGRGLRLAHSGEVRRGVFYRQVAGLHFVGDLSSYLHDGYVLHIPRDAQVN